ncbi:bifunctional lysylphosphatidylglycerol synthetase/lysine--tRNA ligase LysX [Streptomyces mayteni]
MPSLLGTAVALVGAFCAVSALLPFVRAPFADPRQVVGGLLLPLPANLPYGVCLLLLAAALTVRKRVAWYVVTLGAAALLVVHLARAASVELWVTLAGAGCAALLLALLWWSRAEFHARVRRGAFWRALGALVVGLAVATGLGWLMVSLFPGSLAYGDRLAYAADRVFGGFGAARDFAGHPPVLIRTLPDVFGTLAVLNALVVLFRSQRALTGLSADDETRLRALLARHGRQDSLGYFATRRDKNAVFAPDGRAAVTYRVEAGVCLAGGDPIGDRDSWDGAIAAWGAMARGYAWLPAVLGAGEQGAAAFARAGFRVLHLGDEAILRPAEFDRAWRSMRGTRQAVNRVRRTGARIRIRRHQEVDEAEFAGLRADIDAWRGDEQERGFSMALGRLGDPADGRCLLVEALAGGEADEADQADAARIGILSLVPWGHDGVSLDLMRRAPDAPNGTVEFMVAGLAAHGPALGIRRVSLNFAVGRSVLETGARLGAGPVVRMWRRLLLFFSRFWQLETMYRATAKYRPEWYPRFLCYGEPGSLARVGLSLTIVEGFFSPPHGRGGVRPIGAVGLPPLTDEERELAADVTRPPGPAPAGAEGRPTQQQRVRRAKLAELRARGVDPYPPDSHRTSALAGLRTRPAGTRATVVGRVLLVRDFGGVVFVRLRDGSGELQLILTRGRVGADALRRFVDAVDRGDQIEATGESGSSRRGEPSLLVASWRLVAKCLRPLPDARHRLTDPVARSRGRPAELVVRPAARAALVARSTVLRELREALWRRGYTEVETPMLEPLHAASDARPFVTHGNAYDMELALRVAPEPYLKRLCVAGFDRIFELGRAFRNEGVSHRHSPEFTILEAYRAGADQDGMRELTGALVREAATAMHGAPLAVTRGADGGRVEHDLSGEWPVVGVYQAISAALGEEIGPDTGDAALRTHCAAAGVDPGQRAGHAELVDALYERLVQAVTGPPVFYRDFPLASSPLVRADRHDPRLAERWDLVAWGMELGTGATELTDPIEQRRRLLPQAAEAALEPDEGFLAALEYGMPPTGGLGLGVDRLIMLLTGLPIRETLPFPLIRGG